MKTVKSETFYVLHNTEDGKFGKFRNVGGFDNEVWKVSWVKDVEKATWFSSKQELLKYTTCIKNPEKFYIATMKKSIVFDCVCNLSYFKN